MIIKKTIYQLLKKFILPAIMLSFSTASLAAFPDRPITLLIPYPPGGSADMLARPIVAEMQKNLNQSVIIEYKPGAGGTIASSLLARSKPDGHTLVMVLAAHAINPSMYAKLPYDSVKDFAPVGLLAKLPMVVVTPPSSPFNNIQDLINYAKTNPNELTFASAGNGNTSHLTAELFKNQTAVEMLHVPYNGSSPAVIALLSGEVSLMFDSISTSLPHINSKKLKALAVTSNERSKVAPEVPTLEEAGIENFQVSGWYGILAPNGTPEDVIEKLNLAFKAAAKTPVVKEQLESYGYQIQEDGTAKEFADFISEEMKRWKIAVDASGARIQ